MKNDSRVGEARLGEPKRNRITWVDMAKGYGILLVILGHLHLGKFDMYIYSFHMPLFFFLSGVVFRPRPVLREFVCRKIRTMIVPYFALGVPIILYAWLSPWYGPPTLEALGQIALDYVIQRRRWDVWFLACLFCLNIIYWVILVKIRSNKVQILITTILPVIAWTYYQLGGKAIPWNVDISFMAAPFFYFGYQYKSYDNQVFDYLHNHKRLYSCSIIVFATINVSLCAASAHISGESLNMNAGNYGIPPLTFVSALAGIAVVLLISHLYTFCPIKYIGENSLLYFVWHEQLGVPVSIVLFDIVGLSWNDAWPSAAKIGHHLLQLFLIVGGITICNLIISKTKLRFMIGK